MLHEVGSGYWVDGTQRQPFCEGVVQAAPEYLGFRQWLERTIGLGFDAEYPPGTLIHVVDAAAIGFAPRAGDHVIITRARDEGRQVERSIREVAFEGARRVFRVRSSDPSLVPPLELSTENDGAVAGLILGSYRPRR